MSIDSADIAEIRERVDMVALVSEYVRLKKRGNNHVGLCPFHAEKTPSFNVHALTTASITALAARLPAIRSAS